MISVNNIGVEFGVKPLFSNVSFVVNDNDRIALVGKNGAGKSTLLKILYRLQSPTSGNVSVSSDTTIGYLPQVMNLKDDTTVREEASKAFAGISSLKAELDRLNAELAQREDYESESYLDLVERFTATHDKLQILGADNCEANLERTLSGLGFKRTDFDRPTKEFSGGWRMRIELAKILLQKPDVLLLDEPTNHLDIESIQWLEQFLSQSAKSVVLVSHDLDYGVIDGHPFFCTCGMGFDAYISMRFAEHAARMVAMQTATDNADELLRELNLQYNKSRQQAITNELLDIVGGSVNN
jgi:ATP-binding cassette, subfamily F, member 3